MELFESFEPKRLRENTILNLSNIAIAYSSISGLLDIYSLKQEKSIVQVQNQIALSQYLPTNNTLFLKNQKQKKVKLKYVIPNNWSDAFKLIKLLWQTRQLA